MGKTMKNENGKSVPAVLEYDEGRKGTGVYRIKDKWRARLYVFDHPEHGTVFLWTGAVKNFYVDCGVIETSNAIYMPRTAKNDDVS